MVSSNVWKKAEPSTIQRKDEAKGSTESGSETLPALWL